MNSLVLRAEDFAADLVELRRDLHRHPELSFQEHRTAALMADTVEELGFRVQRAIGRTGVVAEIGDGGPIIALRADMDALPVEESADHEYRSTIPGVMHACGHDAHMAMLIGAARLLAEFRSTPEWPGGTIRLLFQPSEEASDDENRSGAARMIDDGAMKDVATVFGLHIGGNLRSGKVHVRAGPLMAGSDRFTLTVHGRSAHAARPEEGIDSIVLAAHVVLACQNAVARRISPAATGVLTIGKLAGGVAENVIADRVEMVGTVRYFDDRVREALHRELRSAAAVADALGGRGELDLREGYPPVVNDETATEIATSAIADLIGADEVVDFEPSMYAEDFAILQREAPGCFMWLGAALETPREHHRADFDIDEDVLPRGAGILAGCAIRALEAYAR